MKSSSRRVLIYRLGSLGDTVMALPCFHMVRESFPDAAITLLTNQPVMTKAAPLAAVLGEGYFFDQVLAYPVGIRNPVALARLAASIWALRIDTVVNLTAARTPRSTWRDQLFFRAAGARQLIGFPSSAQDFGAPDPHTGELEWEAQKLAHRLAPLGKVPLDNDHYWDLRLTVAEQQAAVQALSPLPPTTPILAISIGTKLQANNWGDDNWRALLRRLPAILPGWRLVVIGAPEEASLSDSLLHIWGKGGLNLCGQTSPRVSAAVLQHASLFIGHDSGPLHLAACSGAPCVGIFGARHLPYQWYPRGGSANKIIYHRTDCAGCGLEICVAQQKKCILSISVEEVMQAVSALAQPRSRPSIPTS